MSPNIRLELTYRRHPETLRQMAVYRIGRLISDFCMAWSNTRTGSKKVQIAIKEFQGYLLSYARHIWPDITQLYNILIPLLQKRCSVHSKGAVDPLILLSVLIHDDMRAFVLDERSVASLHINYHVRYLVIQHLLSFRKLIFLDLSGVGYSNADFQHIGQNCPVLETIVMNTQQPFDAPETDLPQFTEIGLLQLVNCTMLKAVVDDGKLETFKPEVIARLLTALKNLIRMDYEYMEVVLTEHVFDRTLKLRDLQLCITAPENVALIAKLCPYVSTLRINQNAEDLPGLLTALGETHWRPNVLILRHLFYNAEMQEYLKKIGNCLEVLNITSICSMDINDIAFVGETCRYLTNLTIKCITDSPSMPDIGSINIQHTDEVPAASDTCLHPAPFETLMHLQLEGHVIDDGSLFKQFVQSQNIVTIDTSRMQKKLHSLTYNMLQQLLTYVPGQEFIALHLDIAYLPCITVLELRTLLGAASDCRAKIFGFLALEM